MEENGLYRLSYPSRVYLETTTRCNLLCEMCVKQSSGGGIVDGDFDMGMMPAIEPVLCNINTLILSGIGEPVLYPDLETLIRYASRRMMNDSRIGFQTNGMLVSRDKAMSLVEAGLNLVCVSMDASTPGTFSAIRKGGNISDAENSIQLFMEAGLALNREVKAGIEFVLTRDNLHQLVPALEIAAARGAKFAIVTHLIPYDERMSVKAAYDRNTDMAINLYEKTLHGAAAAGIDITKYHGIRWRFSHTPEDKRIIQAVEDMISEAERSGIFLNLQGVMNMESKIRGEVGRVFSEAEAAAHEFGIELSLPASAPRALKRCDFIESGSVFISWNGDIHPCHFLWHKCRSYISGWEKFINPVSFGNLKTRTIADIWNSDEYIQFRSSVARYDYPVCSNCGLAPCDYIYSEIFEQDCYTNTIPCCDCQWCLGLFQCLR
ncbi:MAG TPA: radical SAM/SPASM family putative metalloenzyme maturase [Spirochaetota bacterium]|nr:radical SAM/SPASM family putative metalloenzyme maturase [Spirochaetota bacterium]